MSNKKISGKGGQTNGKDCGYTPMPMSGMPKEMMTQTMPQDHPQPSYKGK